MSFFKNLIETHRLETVMVILGLSWLTNPVFILIFMSLLLYYYRVDKRTKVTLSVIYPPFRHL